MKYKWLPVFDVEKCTACRACTDYCVSESLTVVDDVIVFSKPEACLSDELCVRECPSEGIHMEWLPVSDSVHLGKVADQKPQLNSLS